MDDLLQALMQGGQPQSSAPGVGSNADPMAQLLQSLLAGGAPHGLGAQAAPPSAPAEPDMAGLLGSILGGAGGFPGSAPSQSQAAGGGLGDLLGAILGGGSPALESNSILGPIVNGLAEKIGLPPQLAQAVVAFVLGKLVERRLQPATAGLPLPAAEGRAARPQAASLETVLQRLNSGKPVTKTAVRSAGLARELSAHTGLNRATAEASVQQVLNALGGQLGTGL